MDESAPPQSPRARRRRSSVSDSFNSGPSDWSPASLYSARPPPSAFPSFPFQAYAGNPDPGTPIPGYSRRSSYEETVPLDARHTSIDALEPANVVPFVAHSSGQARPSSSSSPNSIYGGSVAHHITSSASMSYLPSPNARPSSTFRAPFLSPASRPSSGAWSPPSYPDVTQARASYNNSPSVSSTALAGTKAPLPSTRLSKPLKRSDKPWLLSHRGPVSRDRDRLSYLFTVLCLVLGLGGAGALCFFGTRPNSIHRLQDKDLCLVLDDQFNGGDLDSSVWKKDVGLGGFGNGEFQVMTSSSDNAKIVNNQLYIVPTLTSARIGADSILDGFSYSVDGCTTPQNKSTCAVRSSANTSTVIPPVESARLTTSGTKSIRYGRVEVKAKLPQGDWLWPAIWLLPQDNKYGSWPLSGEIDIMEARGNGIGYGYEGLNYVRSTLNYGPLPSLLTQLTASIPLKRAKLGYAETFHTYTLEWSPTFIRMFIDSRLKASIDISTTKKKEGFFARGGYPATAPNGTANARVVVENPWEAQGGGLNAPYDQDFYLIISLAAGGTSGWFPDNLGGKPWADGSLNAMTLFAKAESEWSQTWPQNEDNRAFRIDYVKMWQLGACQ